MNLIFLFSILPLYFNIVLQCIVGEEINILFIFLNKKYAQNICVNDKGLILGTNNTIMSSDKDCIFDQVFPEDAF